MKKRKPPRKTLRSDPIGDDLDVEMLYAAAEAHPNWEVMPDGAGIRHLGREAPNTPRELLEWFSRKGQALGIGTEGRRLRLMSYSFEFGGFPSLNS